jgi:hypothetical protein
VVEEHRDGRELPGELDEAIGQRLPLGLLVHSHDARGEARVMDGISGRRDSSAPNSGDGERQHHVDVAHDAGERVVLGASL